MTKSTQRARHASEPKSAVRQRAKKIRASESPKSREGLFVKTDVTPEQFFQAWSRKEREALIELLIDSLDETDGDADLEETGDAEPSLGFQVADRFVGRGCEHVCPSDDREIEDEHDEDTCDREGDELQHGGDEHDGCEPDEDGEPSLGWTVDGFLGNSDGMDREAAGSSVTEAHRQRYRPFDRYVTNCDGMHVDAYFDITKRKLFNLSDRQHAALAPRVNRDEVRI
jgi:hypothetical protein